MTLRDLLHVRLILFFLSFLFASSVFLPQYVQAQNNSSTSRKATLIGWETNLWLFVKDRANNLGGFSYDRGLFRMTTVPMDMEYQLDIFTYRHSYFDDYRWYNSSRNNGFRSSFGSINTSTFALKSELKSELSLNKNSSLQITARQQEDLRAQRGLIVLDYTHKLSSRNQIGATHTLSQTKSDIDASFYYKYGNFDRGQLTAEVTALDWANNFVSDLSSERNTDFEIRQVYSRVPVLYTLRLQSPEIGIFRGEAVASVQPQSRAEVFRVDKPDQNYHQNDWVNYQAALIEASYGNLTGGIIYQRTFARMEREPAIESNYEFDYGNRQIQQRGGFYFTWQWRSFGIEQWLWIERNRDEQFDENPEAYAAQNDNVRFYDEYPERYPFDFEEVRHLIKTRIFYAPNNHPINFYLEHNGDWRTPHFDSGSSTVRAINYRNYYPNHIVEQNERLTLGIGLRLFNNSDLTIGASLDLDGDKKHGFGRIREKNNHSYFDGGFCRLQIFW